MTKQEQIEVYRDHIRDIERQMATLEEAREYAFTRIDEITEEN